MATMDQEPMRCCGAIPREVGNEGERYEQHRWWCPIRPEQPHIGSPTDPPDDADNRQQ